MEHATPDDKPEASKPVNWHSGWRFWVTIAVTFLAVKLIGPVAAVVAAVLFFWLQPKRGTGIALLASVAAATAVSVVLSVALLSGSADSQPPQQPAQMQQPAQQAPAQGVSPNNPFTDPNYGKELLQKQQ